MKDSLLQIRVSSEFKQLLSKQAGLYGMSLSEYIRFLVLEDSRRSKSHPSSPTS